MHSRVILLFFTFITEILQNANSKLAQQRIALHKMRIVSKQEVLFMKKEIYPLTFLKTMPAGLCVGFLAGLFGAGGGMIAVPALKWLGFDEAHAHASSLAVMLPLSLLSAMLYLNAEQFRISAMWAYWPGGIAGAVIGAVMLPKLKAGWIRRIFAVMVLACAARLLI